MGSFTKPKSNVRVIESFPCGGPPPVASRSTGGVTALKAAKKKGQKPPGKQVAIQTPPLPKVKINTHKVFDRGKGAFEWYILFSLDRAAPSDGWVVQKIETSGTLEFLKNDYETVDGKPQEYNGKSYWEAWPVKKNALHVSDEMWRRLMKNDKVFAKTWNSNTKLWDDNFMRVLPTPIRTDKIIRVNWQTTGIVQFHAGATLPGFKKPGGKGAVPEAGNLLSTYTSPSFWTVGGTYHTAFYTWAQDAPLEFSTTLLCSYGKPGSSNADQNVPEKDIIRRWGVSNQRLLLDGGALVSKV